MIVSQRTECAHTSTKRSTLRNRHTSPARPSARMHESLRARAHTHPLPRAALRPRLAHLIHVPSAGVSACTAVVQVLGMLAQLSLSRGEFFL